MKLSACYVGGRAVRHSYDHHTSSAKTVTSTAKTDNVSQGLPLNDVYGRVSAPIIIYAVLPLNPTPGYKLQLCRDMQRLLESAKEFALPLEYQGWLQHMQVSCRILVT